MNMEQMREYDIILNAHDNEWDMYNWLVGKDVSSNAPPSDECDPFPQMSSLSAGARILVGL